jgi:hypothetical protein
VLAMVGDAPTMSPRMSLPAGLGDLGAAAAVLVVGGDIADPGVQPDGVVVGADHLQFGAELVGVADAFQVGHSPLTCPKKLSIGAWSVGGCGRPKCWTIEHKARNSLVDPRSSGGRCRTPPAAAAGWGRLGPDRPGRPGGRPLARPAPRPVARHRTRPGPGWRSPRRYPGWPATCGPARSMIANAQGAARQQPKWVTSQPHTWVGRYSSQSGQGCHCTGARPGGLGSTRL